MAMNGWIEKLSAIAVLVVVLVVVGALLRLVLDNVWYILAVVGALLAAGYLYSQTKR
jgi:hypothetical protein